MTESSMIDFAAGSVTMSGNPNPQQKESS